MMIDFISEKKAIQQLVKDLEESWNNHDVKAYAGAFAEDAEFTTVFGNVNRGRKTIEEGHAFVFSTVFKNSHIVIVETKIKFIKTGVASVHIRWEMTGATLPDGTPWKERKGLLAWIVVYQNERWEIVVAHNSELVEPPPRFFLHQQNEN